MKKFHGKNMLKQWKINFLKTLLLCKAKQLLDSESLKTIQFSNSFSYLNYGSIAWASTNPTKLEKIHYLQKQAVC